MKSIIKKEEYQKKYSRIKRFFEDFSYNAGVYFVLLFIIIVIYGFFGINRLNKVMQRKKVTIQELQNLNETLSLKKNRLDNFQSQIFKIEYLVGSLSSAIPKTPEIENYIIIFNQAAQTNGFKTKKFDITGYFDDRAEINVALEGAKGGFVNLIKDIETLPRLTKIISINYNFREDTASISMKLEVYFISKE